MTSSSMEPAVRCSHSCVSSLHCRSLGNCGWMGGQLCPFMGTRVSKRGTGCWLSSSRTRAQSCWLLMLLHVVLVGQSLNARFAFAACSQKIIC